MTDLKLIFVFTFLCWSHCGRNYYYYYYSYLITHLYCCTEWFHSIIFIILQYLVLKLKIHNTNQYYIVEMIKARKVVFHVELAASEKEKNVESLKKRDEESKCSGFLLALSRQSVKDTVSLLSLF